MLVPYFAVYDSAIKAYMSPFAAKSVGDALRMFTDAANSPDTQLSRHPADFTLFHVASYDDETGKFTPLETFPNLGTALSVKNFDQGPALVNIDGTLTSTENGKPHHG